MDVIDTPQGKRQVRLLLGLACFGLALVIGLLWAASAYAGGAEPVKLSFDTTLENVQCLGWRCAATVEGTYHGQYFTVAVRGWRWHEGQAVTVTGTLRGDTLTKVRVR